MSFVIAAASDLSPTLRAGTKVVLDMETFPRNTFSALQDVADQVAAVVDR